MREYALWRFLEAEALFLGLLLFLYPWIIQICQFNHTVVFHTYWPRDRLEITYSQTCGAFVRTPAIAPILAKLG